MTYVLEKMLKFESEEIAKKFQDDGLRTQATSDGWYRVGQVNFTGLMMRSVDARPFDEHKLCVTCNQPVQEVSTYSEIYKTISVLPAECNKCRIKAFEDYEQAQVEAKRLSTDRCGKYANQFVKHEGGLPSWSLIDDGYEFQRELLDYTSSVLDDGNSQGAYISGTVGTGKTFLSKLLNNELIEQGRSVCFIKATELTMLLRRASRTDLFEGYVDDFKNIRTLIIDDLGTQKDTEFVSEVIFSIIDHRYDHLKQTIITSNLDLDNLGKRNSRIASRCGSKKWMKNITLSSSDLRNYQIF